ncbi:DNA adenine methylase [Salmonella enterica subsp. enterica]|nr:DNA adenine methylase [Salmonella enterica subsp. enterica]
MGHEPEWKVEKQPRWLVAAIKKTISSLHGGYEEAAEWLDVTKDALFNRLRTGGDQIFPIRWALVLQRAGGTYHLAHSVARASGGVFVPLADMEEVDMRYIMRHTSAMRDKGGRYVFLIKAATSEVWWPEDADHIAFICGRIGFELPAWFIPKDEKQVPTGAFFAGAIAVFDKSWKGPAISYIGRDELEAGGEAFLAQIRREAKRLVGKMVA